ncbi:MAG TPA: long-chain-fatty-acid--CoA ligase [Planktothrix sp.]
MDLSLSLKRAVALWPDQEALVDGHKRFTYEQFGNRVASLAAWLRGFGINKGDVAAIIAPNCHEFMEAYYACAVTGIILNPLNYRLSPTELVGIVADSEAKIILVHTDFADNVRQLAQEEPKFKRIIWFGAGRRQELAVPSFDYEELISNSPSKTLPDVNIESDDLAQLYYTSGTTGKAKGVMLTHGNATFNALGAVSELQLTDSDVWAHVAPIFHLADAWSLFAITWVGGKHVFVPYFKPVDVLRSFEKEKVTITTMVPTMVNTLLHEKLVHNKSNFSLRLILTAGSPVAPEQVKQIVNAFNCDYLQFYGLTETSPFLTISKPKAKQQNLPEDKLLEIKSKTGRAFIGVQVKVVRRDGTDVERDGTEVGEVIAKGPVVFKGYWKQPDITAETLKDGWIHTGDLAVMDEEGFINIVDRKKDMIITGGENVYSTEVEYALYEHPAVLECAVFGVPDPDWGELVAAAIVVRAGYSPTESDMIAFVKERLAKYKAPRAVEFVIELPKTGSGKIYKRGLREKHWGDRHSQVN